MRGFYGQQHHGRTKVTERHMQRLERRVTKSVRCVYIQHMCHTQLQQNAFVERVRMAARSASETAADVSRHRRQATPYLPNNIRSVISVGVRNRRKATDSSSGTAMHARPSRASSGPAPAPAPVPAPATARVSIS